MGTGWDRSIALPIALLKSSCFKGLESAALLAAKSLLSGSSVVPLG